MPTPFDLFTNFSIGESTIAVYGSTTFQGIGLLFVYLFVVLICFVYSSKNPFVTSAITILGAVFTAQYTPSWIDQVIYTMMVMAIAISLWLVAKNDR